MKQEENFNRNPEIHEIPPREIAGRDVVARFDAQFRAAGYACLSILDNTGIDKVYCDYQDDFVCREVVSGKHIYHFNQVKTNGKRNALWRVNDLFGLKKQGKTETEDERNKKLGDSFIGKLLVHAVRFKDSCGSMIFLTNIHLHDDVEEMISDIDGGKFSNKNVQEVLKRFNAALLVSPMLSEEEVKGCLCKLSLEPGKKYLDKDDHGFEALAKEAIYKYSEIDLGYLEAKEIIANLVEMVRNKSMSTLVGNITPEELDLKAGIDIDDLLEIMSISRTAYRALVAGGDESAVKNASIIQRLLQSAGASDEMIEYCSECKIKWDIWLREKRHTIPPFEYQFLQNALNGILQDLKRQKISLIDVEQKINELWGDVQDKCIAGNLDKDAIFGGVFAALVKGSL